MSWFVYLNDDWVLGVDEDVFWDNVVFFWKWGKDGGEKDDFYKKGEVVNKDGGGYYKCDYNQIEIVECVFIECEFDYGFVFYCVECGFSGEVIIWGEIDVFIFFFEFNIVQVGFNVEFYVGVNIGMQVFVKYEKSWEKDIFKIFFFGGFSIFFFVDVGFFISVGVEVKVGIEVIGILFVGVDINWDDIDIMIDFFDFGNSYV